MIRFIIDEDESGICRVGVYESQFTQKAISYWKSPNKRHACKKIITYKLPELCRDCGVRAEWDSVIGPDGQTSFCCSFCGRLK